MANTSNINLEIIADGDDTWLAAGNAETNAVDAIGNLGMLVFDWPNVAEAGVVIVDGIELPEDITIKKITIYAGTAPTGQDMLVDLLKGGSPQSKIATLTAGQNSETTTLGTPINYLKNEIFGLKFTQAGSDVKGNYIKVIIYFQKKAIL